MLYANYRFECRFQNPAVLPVFKGSTLRGVFGRALKKVVCALKQQQCPQCLLRSDCLYTKVFEPQSRVEDGRQTSGRAALHPFVIQPPLDDRTDYAAGDILEFNLILVGEANQRLPYFIYALDQMGRIGLGRKIAGRRGNFCLEKVLSRGRRIYSGSEGKISSNNACAELVLSAPDHALPAVDTITFHFLTPLRLKHRNSLSTLLPFHVLVRSMLRRASSLLETFGSEDLQVDFKGMVRRAEAVQIRESRLQWEDWRRYSSRQEQSMQLGGLKGEITYLGALREYLPLIEFCQKVHLGKQTTFGLGRFIFEVVQ